MGPSVGAVGDVGDTGRNRVTADVSHVYFYSVSQSQEKITAKQTCYTSPVSYQQIRNPVYCKSLPFFVAAVLLAP